MVYFSENYIEECRRKQEEQEIREKKWIKERFGEGPFTDFEKAVIEELRLIKNDLNELRRGVPMDY